jgi:DHA1 family bicyclomycin/chloramphenicol resistance-like MFS transporter
MAFPTLTLLLLDRFPRQRGGASSVQAFASLLCTGVVAGVLSPVLSVSMLALALGATAMVSVGLLAWWWYAWLLKRELARHADASLRDVGLTIKPQEPV